MKPFRTDDTPETFDGFVKSVKNLIEETDVEEDDWYPDALFTVDTYGIGRIINVDDIVENHEITHQALIETLCVNHIKSDNIKWYAYVSYFNDVEDNEFLHLVCGEQRRTTTWITKIFYDNGYQYIEDWRQTDPRQQFTKIIVPLRQAICNQG